MRTTERKLPNRTNWPVFINVFLYGVLVFVSIPPWASLLSMVFFTQVNVPKYDMMKYLKEFKIVLGLSIMYSLFRHTLKSFPWLFLDFICSVFSCQITDSLNAMLRHFVYFNQSAGNLLHDTSKVAMNFKILLFSSFYCNELCLIFSRSVRWAITNLVSFVLRYE